MLVVLDHVWVILMTPCNFGDVSEFYGVWYDYRKKCPMK
jgi:hypothetical protein